MGEYRGGVEQQLSEVFQSLEIGQALTAHFGLGELADGGEGRVHVFHATVPVHQDEGAGALLHCALEQAEHVGRTQALLVGQYLRVLIGQFTGEGDFVGMPGPWLAAVLQAEHADHFPADPYAGIQNRANGLRSIDAFVQFTGAVILANVLGIYGAAALQRLQIARIGRELQRGWRFVMVSVESVARHRLQARAVQMPDRGTAQLVDLAGRLGDQLRGLLLWVGGAVAMPSQPDDQVLLGA